MLSAFADWIEKGYRGLAERSNSPGSLISYRFWVGGPRGGSLLCGVVKDSSDSLGRPYPLILMGMGPLASWDSYWHQIPMACESCWSQLESISTRMYRDFKQLEADLRAMKPPAADWDGFAEEARSRQSPPGEGSGSPETEDTLIQRLGSDVLFMPVAGDRFGNSTRDVHRLHALLKSHGTEMPKAVFMGGMPARTMIAVFKRPLLAEDFGKLWFAQPI